MALTLLAWLSNPVTCMVAMMFAIAFSHVFRKIARPSQDESRIVRVGSGGSEAVAAALMFLTTAYRPSVEFIAQAQIQEHEDADDDDQGGPDSPKKHLQRQLRRIRNGVPLDRLVWRLE
jgi:predicted phosphoribosyltransferase